VLDELDPVPGKYTLEVSSPGLERTLRTPDHYRRAIGEKVRIKLRAELEGTRRIEGVLTDAGDDGVTVDDRRVSYADIDRARTVFEWGPTPKPGKASPPKQKAGSA
jgi:ribosome maturation factor RimP